MFNPCNPIDFTATYETGSIDDVNYYSDISVFAGEYETFAMLYDGSTYVPLMADGVWSGADSALYVNGTMEDNSKADGLSVAWNSNSTCTDTDADGNSVETTFGITLNVWCNPDVTAEAKVTGDEFGACMKVVDMEHAAGCAPEYNMLGFIQFMADNYWISGTALVLIGGFIGVFGRKWFIPITGGFAGLCAFIAVMILCSMFHWLDSTGMMIVSFLLGCAGAFAAYWFMTNDFLATMFLCIGGGFLLGGVVEGLIIAISGWGSFAFYMIITIIFMVVGGFIGYRRRDTIQKYLTASVGSYMFMRGWTFFGDTGFPSEMEMYNMMAAGKKEELVESFNGMFWFFVALFVGCTFLCIYIQENWEYAKPAAKTDDNFEGQKSG